MGFVQQFQQRQPPKEQEFRDRMAQLRSMLQGDVQPLIQQAISSGATCTMPDGRKLTYSELAGLLQGKSADDAMRFCGYDPTMLMGLLNS
jgi:hypothetical protein